MNSSLFKGCSLSVKPIPFIRSKTLFPISRDKESISSLPGRFRSFCPNYSGSRLRDLRIMFLKENRGLIEASRRSLTRGLGLPLKLDEIMEAGLWFREAWYLSLEVEKPLPSPYSEWMRKPEGWTHCRVEKITKEHRKWQKEVSMAFVESSWLPPQPGRDREWEEELVFGLFDYGHFFHQRTLGIRRRARLLNLSIRNTRRFLSPDRNLLLNKKFVLPRRGVWIPCLNGTKIQVEEEVGARTCVTEDLSSVPPPFCLTQ